MPPTCCRPAKPAKPGQHGTPKPGRSFHPLILCNIARSRRCTVSNASTTPKPLRRWLHRIGTHSRFSRQDTGYAQSLCFARTLFGVCSILHGSQQPVHAVLSDCSFVPFVYLEGRQPLPVQKRLVSQWPVTGLPEKRLPKGNPTVDSRLSIMGTTSFWPTAGPANWSPSGFQMRDLPAREQF